MVCRPRLLFQYLPYIQQDALRLDAQDVEAVLEATCGGGGAAGGQSSIWGVMLSPCFLAAHANSAIRHMSSYLCPYSLQAKMNFLNQNPGMHPCLLPSQPRPAAQLVVPEFHL